MEDIPEGSKIKMSRMDNQQINNDLQPGLNTYQPPRQQPQSQVTVPGSLSVNSSTNGWYKATVLRRWVASLVDFWFIFFPVALVLVLIGKSVSDPAGNFFPIFTWVYSVFFIWKFGATLGKKLLKIRVVNTAYQPVSLWKAFLREVIGKFLSSFIFGLGWLWALWDKDRQTWHDKIAGTYVVTKIPNNGKNSVWLYILAGLFILISIIAIVIVSIINPVEFTRRGRDAARLSDFVKLQQAINVAIQIQESTDPTSVATILCSGRSTSCVGSSIIDTRFSDGIGWVKVNLQQQQFVPISTLPTDPLNKGNYKYIYCASGKDWEIVTVLESSQQHSRMATDGGVDPAKYEVGNNFNLLNKIPGCTY